jgi:hypothetical protein
MPVAKPMSYSDNQRENDPSHPLGWTKGYGTAEQQKKGRDERAELGPDKQSPQHAGETWPQFQERISS